MRANNVKQQHGSTEAHHICPDSRGISSIAIITSLSNSVVVWRTQKCWFEMAFYSFHHRKSKLVFGLYLWKVPNIIHLFLGSWEALFFAILISVYFRGFCLWVKWRSSIGSGRKSGDRPKEDLAISGYKSERKY